MAFNRETRELAFRIAHGYCQHSNDCAERANEIHHKLSNTQVNRRRFPLFIDSIFNACPINHGCHMGKPLPRIREHEAEIYEEYLRGLKDAKKAK